MTKFLHKFYLHGKKVQCVKKNLMLTTPSFSILPIRPFACVYIRKYTWSFFLFVFNFKLRLYIMCKMHIFFSLFPSFSPLFANNWKNRRVLAIDKREKRANNRIFTFGESHMVRCLQWMCLMCVYGESERENEKDRERKQSVSLEVF